MNISTDRRKIKPVVADEAARRHGSVLYLLLRARWIHVLVILLVMLLGQLLAYRAVFADALQTAQQGMGVFPPPELLLRRSGVPLVAGLGLVALSVALASFGCGRSFSLGLGRLRVSERSFFLWQALFCTLCYALFLTLQLLLSFFLISRYLALAPDAATSPQTLLLTFSRSGYLHSLLPLHSVMRHIRNGVLLLALGICTAGFSWRRRRNRLPANLIVMVGMVLIGFSSEMGVWGSDLTMIIISLTAVAEMLVSVYGKEASDDETKPG